MSHSFRPPARAIRRLLSLALLTALTGAAFFGAGPARADVIVTASEDKTVKIWKPDGTPVKTISAHDAAVRAVAFSPDGKVMATGGADKKVKLWKVEDFTLIKSFDAHDDEVTCLTFLPDGKRLITGGKDKKLKIWDATDGKLLKSVDALEGPIVGIFALENFVITGGADGKFKVWDADVDMMLIEQETDHVGGLHVLSLNTGQLCLYTSGTDGKIKWWTQSAKGEFDGTQGSAVNAIYPSPDGKLMITGGADGKVKIWDADAHTFKTTVDDTHKGGVTALIVTPDGKMILTGGADGKVRAWAPDGKPLKTVDAHEKAVTVIVYHKDSEAGAGEKKEEKQENK